jgi:LmbE family N-acetylglucosaminyl deacetylase
MPKMPRGRKILFFCAHPDDDTFSSGATIYEMARRGNEIVCVYLTTSPRGVLRDIPEEEKVATRKREAGEACRVVGSRPLFLDMHKSELEGRRSLERIRGLIKGERPDIAFLPHEGEAHPTHVKASRVVSRALENFRLEERWFWESWSTLQRPNFIFFFGDDLMKIKREAMERHESQVERIDEVEATTAFNRFRGIMGQPIMHGFGRNYKGKTAYGEAFLVQEG